MDPPQLSAEGDRVVRVFVSSTFLDMREERERLTSHVWPALRKWCRQRYIELVEVDLRWGISQAQAEGGANASSLLGANRPLPSLTSSASWESATAGFQTILPQPLHCRKITPGSATTKSAVSQN